MKSHFYRTLMALPPVFFIIRTNERVFRPIVEQEAGERWQPLAEACMDTISAILVISFILLCISTLMNLMLAFEEIGDRQNRRDKR